MWFVKNTSIDNDEEALLWKKLQEAKTGHRLWKRLLRNNHAEKCVIFLDNDLWLAGVRYFDAFFASQARRRFLLIYANEAQMNAAKQIISASVQHMVLPEEQVTKILRAFALIDLSKRLTVVSLLEPYNTHGENMLGKKGTTREELVCMDIFRLDSVPAIVEGSDD